MTIQYEVLQSTIPSQLQNVYESNEKLSQYKSEIGDEPKWAWGAVNALRFLGGDPSSTVLPIHPDFDQLMDHPEQFEHLIDFYATLHALCIYKFRWKYPAAGIAQAMRKDFSTMDQTIALLKQIWGKNSLTSYAAWAQTYSEPMFGENSQLVKNQLMCLKEYLNAVGSFDSSNQFIQRVISSFGTDRDLFHLRTHLDETWSKFESDSNSYSVSEISSDNYEIEIVNGSGWFGVLKDFQNNFKIEPGTKVSVNINSIGDFGAYQLSPVTNEWYGSTHEAHLLGN